MSDLLDLAIAGAAGYAYSELSKSHNLRDRIDRKLEARKKRETLEDVIDEFARRKGIYTQKNEFAYRLHRIAERYEEYNYEDVYGGI